MKKTMFGLALATALGLYALNHQDDAKSPAGETQNTELNTVAETSAEQRSPKSGEVVKTKVAPKAAKNNPKKKPEVAAESQEKNELTFRDLEEIKRGYADLSDSEIKGEIADFEGLIASRQFIERANSGQLQPGEMQELSDILQNLDGLRILLVERKLDAIETRSRARRAKKAKAADI